MMIGGGLVYLFLGDHIEALLLLLIASLSVTITLVQETRSENVFEALRNLASPRALVVRDGERMQIAGREVVREVQPRATETPTSRAKSALPTGVKELPSSLDFIVFSGCVDKREGEHGVAPASSVRRMLCAVEHLRKRAAAYTSHCPLTSSNTKSKQFQPRLPSCTRMVISLRISERVH